MATVFRKTYTQHLPKNHQIIEQEGKKVVMWFDRRGKKRFDEMTISRKGEIKLIRQSPTYIARYTDANGVEQMESTNCKDEQSARQVLADLVRRVEHIKAGIITPEQDNQANHGKSPFETHVVAYLQHLKVKTVRGRRISKAHPHNVKLKLKRLAQECKFQWLRDITTEKMERWMNEKEEADMSARTRNCYRAAIVALCNWCVASGRLCANPLARLTKADDRSDRRRVRRALTEEEIARLFKAARLRPIAEFGRTTIAKPDEDKRGRSTWTKVETTFETLEENYERGLEVLKDRPIFQQKKLLLGQQRALMYRILICTGLRKSELGSLPVCQLHLDVDCPHVELLAKDEKAGRGATIPLRADVVDEMRRYMEALKEFRGEARLPHDLRMFKMQSDMIRVYNRDLIAADIDKHDERGRVVDIHALRHTFGTHLARAGVSPRVAMAAMRHSSIELTMNVYTDPALLDVAGAVEALPAF